MLEELQIQNFKAWKDTGKVRLAPLTVFFGTNSSGKSSLAQLLLLLKQTAESPDRQRVLHLGDRKSLVELGTFRDMIHAHDPEATLEVCFRWSLDRPLSFKDPKSARKFQGKRITFGAKIRRPPEGDQKAHVASLEYTLGKPHEDGLRIQMTPAEEGKYRLSSENYDLVRNQGRKWPLPAPIRFYGFPDEAVAYYQNSGFVADLALEMERLLGRIFYLGPLREPPERDYLWSGEVPEHVGWRGERAVEALLAAQGRKISRGPNKRQQPFDKVIGRWLSDLGLADRFAVRPIAKNRKQYEVRLRAEASDSEVNLPDVGFGLSQVLPVIVQCFYVPARSTLILEQPEIHLHPRVQASLADLFIEAVQARENGEDRGIQLLVESHSEHFLRRLQRRVAEQALRPEDVAIYFCEPGRGGAKLRKLDVDPYGNIRNWPEHFFGDEMEDLAAMTEAAIERQMAEVPG